MKLFSNYNFDSIKTSDFAFDELKRHIQILIELVDECESQFSSDDYSALSTNIAWLKRFYEAAERCVMHDQ